MNSTSTGREKNSRLLYDAGIVNQQTGWLGLQKILDDLLDWPAWSGLLVAGGILLIIGIRVTTKLDEINRIERHRLQ
jgi:hypothetical protein